MAKSFRYHGFLDYLPTRADNTNYLLQLSSSGTKREQRFARHELDFLHRFPADQPLTRTNYHTVEIWRYHNLHWESQSEISGKKRNSKKASGSLEQVLTINFAQELELFARDQTYVEVKIKPNVLTKIKDDYYIRGGMLIRKIPAGNSRLEEVKRYLNISIDKLNDTCWYSFRVKTDLMQQKKEYFSLKIINYLHFNGLVEDSKTKIEFVRPILDARNRLRLSYSKR